MDTHRTVVAGEDVRTRVHKIIIEHLGVDPETVTEDATLVDALGADSLDMVELTMAFEEEFGIEIEDERIEEMVTVGACERLITSKRQA